ncbi:MAG: MMPL family transporter, partial [Spirochaetes bacterium]|nr:MMPL family transporter [Spirochaetota bacterium]
MCIRDSLFTSLTTMAGFASFATSSIRPVRVMGVYTTVGVGLAFLLTMLFIPSVLMFIRDKTNFHMRSEKATLCDIPPSEVAHQSDVFMRVLQNICHTAVSKQGIIVTILAGLMCFSLWGMFQLKFETNTMNYLPETNSIRQDITFIEKNMGGTIPFVMLFQAKNPEKDFTHPESIKLLDEIQSHLRSVVPQFSHSFSIVDYFKEVHKAFNNGDDAYWKIPESRQDILDYYEIGEADVLDRIVSPDRKEARISFLSRWDTNETAQRTHAYIVQYMPKKLGNDFTYKITGLSSMYLNMEFKLKASQRNSFIVALCIIFVMMFFVCRKFWLTVIAMIPNIFPIAMTMGLMGWLRIPLDVSTIMIASVTLGIAVDDTIHIITWYTRNMAILQNRKEALLKTFRDVGKPVVITSVVLFMGFFVLILGTIKPTQAFGVLTAFAMLFAMIGDLVFLPALLVFFKPSVANADVDFLREFTVPNSDVAQKCENK